MAASIIMNEKIKVAEVLLTGLDGQEIGVVSREDALAMAKKLSADLVCTSLMSSPPPCRLVVKGQAKQQRDQQKKQDSNKPGKVKELRLTPEIEEHDYETKCRQAQKLLESGHSVLLVVKISGKQGAAAKELLERLVKDLAGVGSKQTGIQISGKQAAVQLQPKA